MPSVPLLTQWATMHRIATFGCGTVALRHFAVGDCSIQGA